MTDMADLLHRAQTESRAGDLWAQRAVALIMVIESREREVKRLRGALELIARQGFWSKGTEHMGLLALLDENTTIAREALGGEFADD